MLSAHLTGIDPVVGKMFGSRALTSRVVVGQPCPVVSPTRLVPDTTAEPISAISKSGQFFKVTIVIGA